VVVENDENSDSKSGEAGEGNTDKAPPLIFIQTASSNIRCDIVEEFKVE
jgi:hypothetical protein